MVTKWFDFGCQAHDEVYRSCSIEMYTGNLYKLTNQYCPNKFNLKKTNNSTFANRPSHPWPLEEGKVLPSPLEEYLTSKVKLENKFKQMLWCGLIIII